MTLKEIRTSKGLTQKQAALLINVPLRTYKRYETDDTYVNSYKYQMFINDLVSKTLVDEEHGLLSIEKIKEVVISVLKEHNINYCYLFGSYAEGRARENSDVDLLIDTEITGFEFLGMVEELRTKLAKKVDLLRLKDLQANNPIVLEILKKGVRII
ncbi:MAG: nucleotidyltransferase domain-containing protein [Bacilli bacterium]|nr:nucleotidyltransferase domain-containing protein [Bacilli bacterium]